MAALTDNAIGFLCDHSLIACHRNSKHGRHPLSAILKPKMKCRCKLRTSHSSKLYVTNDSTPDVLTSSWALYDYSKPPRSSSSATLKDSLGREDSKLSNGDDENAIFISSDTHDKNGRRSSRSGNPSMSLSQSLDMQLNGAYTTEAAIGPATLSKYFPGSAGLYMALVFALVGITTAGASLLGLNSTQEECSKCGGYGVEKCHLCKTTGIVEIEGAFKDVIPCPLCLGSGMEKCLSCDGVRSKRGMPLFLINKSQKASKQG